MKCYERKPLSEQGKAKLHEVESALSFEKYLEFQGAKKKVMFRIHNGDIY